MDLSEFLPDFLAEAQARLDRMEQILATLLASDRPLAAGDPLLADSLDQLFRAAHSLKGTVSFLYLPPITGLARRVETLIHRMQRGEVAATVEEHTTPVRLLMEGVAALRTMLSAVARGEEPQPLPDLEERLERR